MIFEDKVSRLRKEKHQGRETRAFLDDVIALAHGEAFEYLLGEVMFCNARVDLSLRPMIPRPETEYWVKQMVEQTIDKRQETPDNLAHDKKAHQQITDNRQETSEVHEMALPFRALDLFSGSGNVGLAILKNIPGTTVDFIEYDPKLKEQIEISVMKNKIDQSRVKVMEGDGWEGATGVYDLITAVPPYVPPQMKEEVMQELSAEDPLSFFDKEDGYYYHTQVFAHAKDFLNDGGALYLEFDITQREHIEQLALDHGFTSYSFLKDPYGHEYVLCILQDA